MNSSAELLERLLKLYPFKIVKGHFNAEGRTQDEQLPEIVGKNPEAHVFDFAMEYIGCTKQHTFIFELDRNFERGGFAKQHFPLQIVNEVRQDGNYSFVCLPIVEYDIALVKPLEEVVVKFFQPTRVVIKDKTLVVQTTIMERKPKYYFPADRRAQEIGKRNSEDEFIRDIIAFFGADYDIIPCDFNKGIKYLWENDIIDCEFIKYKKAKSTTTESMDEEYTLKTHLPDVYKEATSAPLDKTVFKYLGDDDKFIKHFVAVPSQGQMSTAIFPENPTQTWSVINEILRYN